HRNVQFMYRDGTHYHFMDTTTYDQLALDEDTLGDSVNYLTDGMTVLLSEYEGSPIGVELPASVVLKVTETDLGLKGDTATGATVRRGSRTGMWSCIPATADASSWSTTFVPRARATRICATRRSSAGSAPRDSSRWSASDACLPRRAASVWSRAPLARCGATS